MSIDFYKEALKYKDEAIEKLKEILKFNTVLDEYKENSEAPFGSGNKECLNWFLREGEKDGFKVLNSDNYAGHIEYGSGSEILGILGHLDVVPTTGVWTTPPFLADIRDGKIYARGAADDKGPVIASYYALKMLKDLGVVPNKRIRLIVGCDEESGSRCLNHYFKKEEMPGLGFSPDAEFPLIYGEKAFASFDVVGSLLKTSIIDYFEAGERTNIVPDLCKAKLKKDYTKEFSAYLEKNKISGKYENGYYIINGKSAHGSMPEEGINAAILMSMFINEVSPDNFTKFCVKYLANNHFGEKLGIDITNKDMGTLSMNPGVFKIDDGNIFIGVDCRVPSNDHFDKIDACVSKSTEEFGLIYKKHKRVLMHYVDKDSELVTKLYNAYSSITGDSVNKPFTIGGGTYAKFIDNCVAFGPILPGHVEAIHCPDEYLEIDTFVKCIAIYAKAIYDLVS